jgi:hypothetical protein
LPPHGQLSRSAGRRRGGIICCFVLPSLTGSFILPRKPLSVGQTRDCRSQPTRASELGRWRRIPGTGPACSRWSRLGTECQCRTSLAVDPLRGSGSAKNEES